MWNWWTVWAVGSAAVAVLPAVYVGYVLWVKSVITVHGGRGVVIEPVWEETRLEDLSPEVREFLGETIGQFREAGFEVVANVSQRGAASAGQRSLQVVLADRRTGDVATVMAVVSHAERAGRAQVQSRTLTYWVKSEFRDGRSVATGLARSPTVFPRDPMTEGVAVGWVRDARVLCEFHRRRVAASGRGGEARVGPTEGAEMAYLREQWDREMGRVVAAGYQWRDQAAGRYRPTWKGAALMAWRLVWPLKHWRVWRRERHGRRVWRRERHGRRVWRRMGMEAYRAPEAAGAEDGRGGVDVDEAVERLLAGAGEGLRYQDALGPGDVRVAERAGVAVVRVGGTTGRAYLLRNAISLVWVVAIAGVMGLTLYRYWQWRQMTAMFPPGLRTPTGLPWIIWPLGAWMGWEVWRLTRGARKGTAATRIVATREGLRVGAEGAKKGPTVIRREDVSGVVLAKVWGRAVLYVNTGERVRRVLAAAPRAREEMEVARRALLRGMGMWSETEEEITRAAAEAGVRR